MMFYALRGPEAKSTLLFLGSIVVLILSANSILLPSCIWSCLSWSYATLALYFAGILYVVRRISHGGQYPEIETLNLKGKTFLITGGATGIGKETAKELVKRGARVIIFARGSKLIEAVNDIKQLARSPADVVGYQLDLSDLQSIKNCVDEFMKKEDE